MYILQEVNNLIWERIMINESKRDPVGQIPEDKDYRSR